MTSKKTIRNSSKHLEEWLINQYVEDYEEYQGVVDIFYQSNHKKYSKPVKILDESDYDKCVTVYNYIIACLRKKTLIDRNEFYSKIKEIL